MFVANLPVELFGLLALLHRVVAPPPRKLADMRHWPKYVTMFSFYRYNMPVDPAGMNFFHP
jgi:hypothetical protein